MSLADRMNQFVDDVDTSQLPEPDAIRRAGERRRSQRRTRISVGAAVVAVAAVLIAMAVVAQPRTRTAPAPVGPIDGWRVTRTMEVPGSGGIRYGDASLWVIDMQDGKLNDAGSAPAGDLYQVDPASGDVRDRIPQAVGGWPSLGAGALWLSTAAGGLDVLTRVDLASHSVSRIRTSRPRQLPHGTAFAGGNMWVAHYDTGDLVRMDPETYEVRQTIHLGDSADGRAPQSLISDGVSVWASNDNGLVLRFDGATGEQTSQLQLPIHEARLAGIDERRHVIYANALRGNSLFEIHTSRTGPDRIGGEVQLTDAVDGMVGAFATGGDSVWVATLNPDQLLRIDPGSFDITGRAALPGVDHQSNVPVDLDATEGAVWVRLRDTVVELRAGQGSR